MDPSGARSGIVRKQTFQNSGARILFKIGIDRYPKISYVRSHTTGINVHFE